MAGRAIEKVGAVTLFQIDDDLEPIEQDVFVEHAQNARGSDSFPPFALTQTRPRLAGRLGEHGRHTHPLIVISAQNAVNRRRTRDYFFAPKTAFFSAVAFANASLYCASSAL